MEASPTPAADPGPPSAPDEHAEAEQGGGGFEPDLLSIGLLVFFVALLVIVAALVGLPLILG